MSLRVELADDVAGHALALVTGLRAGGVDARPLDARSLADRDALLGALGESLEFPAYFGRNLDAADECLRDLGWLPRRSRALVCFGIEGLEAADPDGAGLVLELLSDAAEHWAPTETPLAIVIVRARPPAGTN